MLICEHASFSENGILGYDAYWDGIRTENGIIEEKYREGIDETNRKIIAACKASGLSTEQIMSITGLSEEQMNKLNHS